MRSDTRLGRLLQPSASLFGRTFILLALLVTISLAAWFQTFLLIESQPRALRLAQQIAALVNLTSSSLDHTDPDNQDELLADLQSKEGILIFPRTANDQVQPLPDTRMYRLVDQTLKVKLGHDVVVAGSVNDTSGIWVSFTVDNKPFWLNVPRDRFDRISSLEWLGWATIALIVSLLGAGVISSVVVRPVQRLTEAASKLREGKKPAPVPESGPQEIKMLNRTFNEMVKDLQAADEERALILAGISHDLRTPLARLRLEIELSASDEATKDAMVMDIEQMDKIVGQFLEFARPSHDLQYDAVRLGTWLNDVLIRYTQPESPMDKSVEIRLNVEDPDRIIEAPLLDLSRAIINLVENARRYGVAPGQEYARVDISAHYSHAEQPALHISIRDHGPGAPEHSLDKIRQPFMRLDSSRGTTGGSGLGLSIVDRLMTRHGGKLKLSNHPDGGLVAELCIPEPVQATAVKSTTA